MDAMDGIRKRLRVFLEKVGLRERRLQPGRVVPGERRKPVSGQAELPFIRRRKDDDVGGES